MRSSTALFFACLLVLSFFPANAAIIHVTNNSDYNTGDPIGDADGKACTLRKALINAVNGNQTYTTCETGSSGADEIQFSNTSTITVGTMGAFTGINNKSITLTGPKTLQGNTNDELFDVSGSTAILTLDHITITSAGNSAIKLNNQSQLKANNSAFTNNTTGACCGGAIQVSGNSTISLDTTAFTSNTAPNGSGGAIYISGVGANSVTNSPFTNNTAHNSGGAIYYTGSGSVLSPGTLQLTNDIFTTNTAHATGGSSEGGGAIYTSATGYVQLTSANSQYISNTVDGAGGRGGAIFQGFGSIDLPMLVDHGIFTLNTVTGDSSSMGAAIYTRVDAVIRACSFISNDAKTGNGGAIASDAPPADGAHTPPLPGCVVGNSTFNSNSAAQGGAIYSFGSTSREIQILNDTIDSNTATAASGGGGIYTTGSGASTLKNTIVSNNSNNNCAGNNVANGTTNLQYPGSTCAADTAITIGDPKLNSPSINVPDVLTLSMSLNAGSAAARTGTNSVCSGFPILNLDQRSLVIPIRPDPNGTNCDIGAFESPIAPGYGSTPNPSSTINITATTSTPNTSLVTISETGTDDLIISSYNVTGNPQITVSGPAQPFTIADGGASQNLTLTCQNGTPGLFSGTLTVNHNATGSPATYTVNCTVVEPDLTITKTHSGNFVRGLTGSYTITVSNTPAATGSTSGTVTVNDTVPGGLTATSISGTGWTCTQPSGPCTRSDVLAPGNSYPALTLNVNVGAAASSPQINTATVSGGGDLTPANNSVNDSTTLVSSPDLSITKTHAGNFTQGETGATYTITVSNNAAAGPTDGTMVTVSDTLPAGLTATSINGTGWSCTQPSGTCTRSDVLAAGASYPAITLTVNVAIAAGTPLVNTAAVSGGGDVTPGNNTANDSTIINAASTPPDLSITKTHSGNFTQGQTGATYTITVSNAPSAGPTDGTTVTVTDTVPSGLTATSIAGTGWTCTPPSGPCTRSDVLAAGVSYPALTLTVNVSNSAGSPQINTATVSGGGDLTSGNNTANDSTNINALATPPDLSITKSHVGTFTQGQSGATYTITVSNSALAGPTDGTTVTVTDALPAGLTATSINGTGWTCTQPGGSCTRSDVLTAGTSYPALTLTVNVAANAAALVTNNATVAGGGDTTSGNNTASDPTTVNVAALSPDLSITKTHAGNFVVGQTGATYTITVSNSALGGATSGVVTVTDIVPSGLTATAISGTGWTCTQPAGPCTRSDVLPSGSSYPAITLTVDVAGNASSPQVNSANVAGGGDVTAGNNSVNDSTIIASAFPDLTITKTHIGNFMQAQLGASYTITVSNSPQAGPTNGTTVTVTDVLPAGLTATSINGTGWTCTQPAGPCTRSDVLAAGGSYPPLTLTVNVANNAISTVNNATVAGGGDATAINNTTSDPTTIVASNTVASIPTLSTWVLLIFAVLLLAVALSKM